MLKIAICDDDSIFRSILEQMINKALETANHEIELQSYDDGDQLLKYLETDPTGIDILFLDVMLGAGSGLDYGQILRDRHPQVQTIYMSADANYSLDVFDLEPVYFLHKPIDLDRLNRALDLAIRRVEDRGSSHLKVGNRGHQFNILFSEIIFIESERRIIIVHRKGSPYRFYGQLDDIEKMVPDYFIRCHQSYLVNMNFIQAVVNGRFVLNNGRIIPIAQKRRTASRSRFQEFINKT
jgi:two-component system response regulator LytT